MNDLYFPGAKDIQLTSVAQVGDGQDGAICHDLLFKMDPHGRCRVYPLGESRMICQFALDQTDKLIPHGNAVCFGPDYYQAGDEFPLLYTNLYNTYGKQENRREGECPVYRIFRTAEGFSSRLVQIIRVGFVHTPLWRSEKGEDVRPYGNFTIDNASRTLVAFVMRDGSHRTRFFTFSLPAVGAGRLGAYGVPEVTLEPEDVCSHFDTDYMHYMQGATCHNGLVYAVEGFSRSQENPACLRVIDLEKEETVLSLNLVDRGYPVEPEFAEVYQEKLYYAAGDGTLYLVAFR